MNHDAIILAFLGADLALVAAEPCPLRAAETRLPAPPALPRESRGTVPPPARMKRAA